MKVVTPEFNKKQTSAEQVKLLVSKYIPELTSEHTFDHGVFIGANGNTLMFTSNMSAAELNWLLDETKQYLLTGE
jgi:hypothetical protein